MGDSDDDKYNTDEEKEGPEDPWNAIAQEEREEARKKKDKEKATVTDAADDDQGGLVVPVKDLVSFAGKGRDQKERRQAAFGFAHFSTEEDTQKQIVHFKNNYGIDALMSLLESEDAVCQRYASLALGNLVSNPELAPHLIEFGVLEAVLPLAIEDETDLETKRYCCLAVANMAADPQTHEVLLRSIVAIMLLIDSDDEEIQKCAALTIQNLAANNRITLKLDMCVQPLVNLLAITKGKVPLPDAKLHAVAALRGMASQDLMRLRIINEGALRAFVALIDEPPGNQILVEIAAVYASLSSLYETHIDLLQSAVLHSVFLLAMGDIVEAQRYAATTIANMCSNSANHHRLIEANGLPNLLTMCDYQDPQVKSAVARALSNLAADAGIHQDLLNEGCMESMIGVLNEADASCQMFAALFFAILSDNTDIHSVLCIPDLIQPLFCLAVGYDNAVETKRYAILALANLAVGAQSHPFIMSEIEIQMNAFYKLASSKDEETCRYFGLMLSNLAANEANHEVLTAPLALHKCIPLVQNESLEVVINCLSFLLKILISDAIRVRVALLYVSEIVKIVGKWEEEEFMFMVAAFFSTVSTASEVREQTDWVPVLKAIEVLLTSSHQDIQLQSMNSLANLRDVEQATNYICSSDLLPLVLNGIHSPSIEIHSCSLKLIAGLCCYSSSVKSLKEYNMVTILGPFVRSPHSAFRKYAFVGIGNYASHPDGVVDLMDVNLVKCYLNVAIDERSDIEEMRCCLFALANAAYHEENMPHIAESGILISKTLIDYVATQDQEIWEYAALCMCNCSVTLGSHHMFGYVDVMQMIITMAEDGHGITGLHACRALRNLANAGTHTEVMLEAGVIDFIAIHCKKRRKREFTEFSIQIDSEVASLIYNLTQHDAAVRQIADKGTIEPMTSMLVTDHTPTRREIARAMANIAQKKSEEFLKQKELDGLLLAMNFKDMDIYHSAALAFGYIFSDRRVQNGETNVVDGARVMSLLRTSNRQLQICALWGTSSGSDKIICRSADMLQRIAELAEPQLPDKEPPLDENGEQMDINDPKVKQMLERFGETPKILQLIRRRALVTLANYSANRDNHMAVIENCRHVINTIFNLADCHDVFVLRYSALLLSNLAASLELHEELCGHLDVSRLDLLVGNEDLETQLHATTALRQLVVTEKFARQMVLSERLIPLLCLSALSCPVELSREIAAVFRNLSRHTAFIAMILAQHIVPGLLQLFHCEDEEVQTHAMRAIENLSSNPETLHRILEHQPGAPIMWELSPSPYKKVSFGALKVLADVACLPAVQAKFHLMTGLMSPATNQMKPDEEPPSQQELTIERTKGFIMACLKWEGEHEYFTAAIFRELSALQEIQALLLESHGMHAVFKFLKSKVGKTVELALGALGDLLQIKEGLHACKQLDEMEEISEMFHREDVVAILQNICGSDSIEQRILAMQNMCIMLDYTGPGSEIHHRFFHLPDPNESVLPNGFSLMKTNSRIPNPLLQTLVARLFANFSSTESNLPYLANNDMMTLMTFLSDQATRAEQEHMDKLKMDQEKGQEEAKADGQEDMDSGRLHTSVMLHRAVATVIANMVVQLPRSKFQIQDTTLLPIAIRYLNDENPRIRSLALLCLSGVGKTGKCVLFEVWENPMSLIAELLQLPIEECQRNVAKACVLITANKRNVPELLAGDGAGFLFLLRLSMSKTLTVRRVSLVAIRNLTRLDLWRNQHVHYVQEMCSVLESLFHSWREERGKDPDAALKFAIDTVLLSVVSDLTAVPLYHQTLLLGVSKLQSEEQREKDEWHEPAGASFKTVVETCVQITSSDAKTMQRHMALACLVNLSCVNANLRNLLDQQVLEAMLYVSMDEEAHQDAKDNEKLEMARLAMNGAANLVVCPHIRVINGREYRIKERHEKLMESGFGAGKDEDAPDEDDEGVFDMKELPLFDIPVLIKVFDNFKMLPPSNEKADELRSFLALCCSRVTSHPVFTPHVMDLVFFDTLCALLAVQNYTTQNCALITFVNMVRRAPSHCFLKIVVDRNWISPLLCFLQASDPGIRCLALSGVRRLLEPPEEAQDAATTMKERMKYEPEKNRMLQELMSDTMFQMMANHVHREENINAMIELSMVMRVMAENVPYVTLRTIRETVLAPMVELVLNAEPRVHENGSFALAPFLPHWDAIETMLATSQRGYEALFKLLESPVGQEIPEPLANQMGTSHTPITLMALAFGALAAISHKKQLARKIVTEGGLGLITHHILEGVANPNLMTEKMQHDDPNPSLHGAQIIRNICRDVRNMHTFLAEKGLECLLRLVQSASMELNYLGTGALADVIHHATTTPEERERAIFTSEHLAPHMSIITDSLLLLLTEMGGPDNGEQAQLEPSGTPKHGADPTQDSKLVRIAVALLDTLCKDSDHCKELIAQAGAIRPLVSKWQEALAAKNPIHEMILHLISMLGLYQGTQDAFVAQGGLSVLFTLTESNRPEYHKEAATIFHSLSKKESTHASIADSGALGLLLTLRNSKEIDSRRIALDALLTFMENDTIHHVIRTNVDLVQTVVAISKFGVTKAIKARASRIVVMLMGGTDVPNAMDGHHNKPKQKKSARSRLHSKKKQVVQQTPSAASIDEEALHAGFDMEMGSPVESRPQTAASVPKLALGDLPQEDGDDVDPIEHHGPDYSGKDAEHRAEDEKADAPDPELEDAAVAIQSGWRMKQAKEEVAELRQDREEEAAALSIQQKWRKSQEEAPAAEEAPAPAQPDEPDEKADAAPPAGPAEDIVVPVEELTQPKPAPGEEAPEEPAQEPAAAPAEEPAAAKEPTPREPMPKEPTPREPTPKEPTPAQEPTPAAEPVLEEPDDEPRATLPDEPDEKAMDEPEPEAEPAPEPAPEAEDPAAKPEEAPAATGPAAEMGVADVLDPQDAEAEPAPKAEPAAPEAEGPVEQDL